MREGERQRKDIGERENEGERQQRGGERGEREREHVPSLPDEPSSIFR